MSSERKYVLYDEEIETVMIRNLAYAQAVQLRESLVNRGHHYITVREQDTNEVVEPDPPAAA